jgi:uncharacterized protein (DUF302 family)
MGGDAMQQDESVLIHREYVSTRSYAEVVARFEAAIGNIGSDGLTRASTESKSAEEFEARVKKFEGSSGFMQFMKIDHGPWMKVRGLKGRGVLYILGNPLIAQTMIKFDISVGLNVPVRMFVYEDEASGTGRIGYDLPSSLMARLGNEEVDEAAKALDAKMAALAESATG